MVGRCRRMVASTACGVGRSGRNTALAPTDNGNDIALPSPYENESFEAENAMSSARMPMVPWPIRRAVAIRLVCTCLTALGSPVEPDVYIHSATSSDMVGATQGVGSDCAST